MPDKMFGQCECCQSNNVEIREFQHPPITKKLCKLCANTAVGSMSFAPSIHEYETMNIMKSINVVGNEIIRKLTGKPPEFDE